MTVSFKGRRIVFAAALLLAAGCVAAAHALEQVTIERDGAQTHVEGKILVESQDGGLLLLSPDGVLWAIQPEEIARRKSDVVPFQLLGREALAKQVLQELPDGFETYDTAHYLICYNTSKAYAQWCGALYERLYRAFFTYWSQRGFDLRDPEAPLVAVVFADRPTYLRFATADLGPGAEAVIGYYNMRTNRVLMYDLTGVEGIAAQSDFPNSAARINQILSQPQAERTVATIVHEATHQIAFNCGFQERYADIPLWVSEGVAVYFETPDLDNSKGWRGIGRVNRERLIQFRRYLSRRPAESLTTLVANSRRFRNAQTAPDAYAEAWALNYYLLKRRFRDYAKYLQVLSEKEPLMNETDEDRLAAFRAAFGQDLEAFDREFIGYLRGVQ
jgi:hypothetical protein